MAAIQIVTEDSMFTYLARVHLDGAAILQADLTSIAYQIFYTDSATAHTTSTALTVSAVIFDTLQTNARWSTDTTGYNFKHDIAHTVIVDPDRKYRLEYLFTTADSREFILRPSKAIGVAAVQWS